MGWEVVTIEKQGGKSAPFVSIGRGQLQFSALACQLVGDNGQYNYAQILQNKENGKPVIAVKFLEEYDNNTIRIKRKRRNDGTNIPGMIIAHKGVITKLFGKDGSNDGMLRHDVECIGPDMLKIID